MVAIEFICAQLTQPKGLWPIIIYGINNGILNFGWTIVLFTLIVKLALTPLDFWMKYTTKKNTLVQKKCAPQIAKLQNKMKNDPNGFNIQKTNIYKKEGYNLIGSCVFMLVYLVLTMVVFFTLFSSLRDVAAYESLKQYQATKEAYDITLEETGSIAEAEKSANATWNEKTNSWLWVKNIWRNDSNSNPVPSYSALGKIVNNAKDKKGEADAVYKEIGGEETYNMYTSNIQESTKRWNGYFVLAVLAGVTSFLSQFVSELGNKIKRSKESKQAGVPDLANQQINGTTMKMMKFILPAIMVVFVLTSSAAFSIYIVWSSIISTLMTLLTNMIVNKLTKKQESEVLAYLEKQEQKIAKKIEKKPIQNNNGFGNNPIKNQNNVLFKPQNRKKG